MAKKENNKTILIVALAIGGALILRNVTKKEDQLAPDENPAAAYGGYTTGGLPRGIANKNPLNLALSNELWQGKVPNAQNTDFGKPRLEQFNELHYGIRANLKNIAALIVAKGGSLNKLPLSTFISWWGTGKGDQYGKNVHVTNYVNHVVNEFKKNGYNVTASSYIMNPFKSGATLQKISKDFWHLFKGMAEFENGVAYSSTIAAMMPSYNKAIGLLANEYKLS